MEGGDRGAQGGVRRRGLCSSLLQQSLGPPKRPRLCCLTATRGSPPEAARCLAVALDHRLVEGADRGSGRRGGGGVEGFKGAGGWAAS